MTLFFLLFHIFLYLFIFTQTTLNTRFLKIDMYVDIFWINWFHAYYLLFEKKKNMKKKLTSRI